MAITYALLFDVLDGDRPEIWLFRASDDQVARYQAAYWMCQNSPESVCSWTDVLDQYANPRVVRVSDVAAMVSDDSLLVTAYDFWRQDQAARLERERTARQTAEETHERALYAMLHAKYGSP